jgi:hypothetical protein
MIEIALAKCTVTASKKNREEEDCDMPSIKLSSAN